jgi:hypothetical protein
VGDEGPPFGSGPVAALIHASPQRDELTALSGPEKVPDETW